MTLLQKTYRCRLDGTNEGKKKELLFLLSSVSALSLNGYLKRDSSSKRRTSIERVESSLLLSIARSFRKSFFAISRAKISSF